MQFIGVNREIRGTRSDYLNIFRGLKILKLMPKQPLILEIMAEGLN